MINLRSCIYRTKFCMGRECMLNIDKNFQLKHIQNINIILWSFLTLKNINIFFLNFDPLHYSIRNVIFFFTILYYRIVYQNLFPYKLQYLKKIINWSTCFNILFFFTVSSVCRLWLKNNYITTPLSCNFAQMFSPQSMITCNMIYNSEGHQVFNYNSTL